MTKSMKTTLICLYTLVKFVQAHLYQKLLQSCTYCIPTRRIKWNLYTNVYFVTNLLQIMLLSKLTRTCITSKESVLKILMDKTRASYVATRISQLQYIHAASPGCVRREIIEWFGYFIVKYIISVQPLSQASLRRASFITLT